MSIPMIATPTCQFITIVFALSLGTAATAQEQRAVVVIDTSQTRDAIQPYIYGQFIEHLGRCIYGGIWAEMLEDRKFYFPVTAEYDPYKSLQDTDFPVVGASPWRITGDSQGVAMDPQDSFVGEHTPHIRGGSGVEQLDLAFEKDRKYEGRLWLKGKGTVTVSRTIAKSALLYYVEISKRVTRLALRQGVSHACTLRYCRR